MTVSYAATAEPWELWAPPLDPPEAGGLPRWRAEEIAAAWWECDPHLAAALMWESYAAMQPTEPAVRSVQTGVQAVTYDAPGGKFALAMARAAWHRSMAGNLGSVPLASTLERPAIDPTAWWWVGADP
ncbi:MAG: hypothetical protein J2P30_16120 [Actinobacteria bacterium]|nr:hypothetical protein [Actinomycetota bacterium]